MEKIKNFFKVNWKVIVIVLLVGMVMNKCAVSCSRGQKIKQQTTEIISKDSLISCYVDSIKYLNIENDNLKNMLSNEQTHSNAFAGIAIGNQQEISKKIQDLTKKNAQLQRENNKLSEELNACKQAE